MEDIRGRLSSRRWCALLYVLLFLSGVGGQPIKPRYLPKIPIDGESVWTLDRATAEGLAGRSTQSNLTPSDLAVRLFKELSRSPTSNFHPRVRKNDETNWLKRTSIKPREELLELKNVNFSQIFKRLPEIEAVPSVPSTSAPNYSPISSSTTDRADASQSLTIEDYYEELTQMLKDLNPDTQSPDREANLIVAPQPTPKTVAVNVAATTMSSPTYLTEGPNTDREGMWFGSSGGSSLGIRNIMTSKSTQQSSTTTTPTITSTQSQQTTPTTPLSTEPTTKSLVRLSADENDEALAPYIAFNIWSYENGELKLSDVKKIPAQEVLGSEFYSKVTENSNDPVMVLSDSILINGDGLSNIASLSPENVTSMITSTEKPTTSNGSLTHDFSALVDDLDLSLSDQQLLERLLNSANSIPETLTTPIDNLFDFVSYIVDGPPTENSSVPSVTEPSQNSKPITTALLSTTLHASQTTVLDTNSPNQTNAAVKNDSPSGDADLIFSNVAITPEGVHIFNESQGHPAEQPVQQVLSQLDSGAFIFNVNRSSTDPHAVKISLLSDDGIPIDSSLLQNANLISIISNKPTIVNHNIYQIHKSEANVPDPIQQENTFSEQFFHPPVTSTIMKTKTSTNPKIAQNSDAFSSGKKPSDAFPTFTPEEQLFFELERITSFNKILNGGVNLSSLRNVSALESLALKGIFDSKPELLKVAKKKNSVVKREPASPEENLMEMDNSASYVPQSGSNVHALELDVLPLGISDESISVGQMEAHKNADLLILESLLREQKLPKVVERAILLDIISGKPVSECILTNIDKYWVEIEEHLKKVSPLDAGQSPLAVIEDLEKKLTEETTNTVLSNGTDSSHTFKTHVDVDDSPKNTSSQSVSTSTPNLQNCFKDRACTFALSIALAAGTTGALSVPFLTPVLGRSLKTSLIISKPQVPNELMTVEDAQEIIAAVTRYSQRNGKTLRGDHVNLRRYMSPFVSYLGHKVFPSMFGPISDH